MQRSLAAFKIYPAPSQARRLEAHLEACRRLYNACLEQRLLAHRSRHKTPSEYDQNLQLPEVRRVLPEYADVPAGVLQSVPKRVHRAFVNFFEGRARHPRFKSRTRYDTLHHLAPLAPHGHGTYRFEPRRVYLTRVGRVRHKLQTTPRWFDIDRCVPKVLTLRRVAGAWQARVTFDVPEPPVHASAPRGSAIGLDAGLHHLLATSGGETVENPRWLGGSLKRLRRAQRSLGRRLRGGRNRRKQERRVARIHHRVKAQRLDHHHKLSSLLATRYRLVAVEDNLTGLGRSRLARSVLDAGWGGLYRLLEYKLDERGGRLVRVDPRGTSRTCSACHHVQDAPLAVRVWRCGSCGLVLDRDVNAARNILARALDVERTVPRDTRELTPGETGGAWTTTRVVVQVPVVEPGTPNPGFLNSA